VEQDSGARNLTNVPALVRVAIAGLVGVSAAIVQVVFGPNSAAPLVGWDALALTYVCLTWWRIWPLDAEQTARRATRHDPTRTVSYGLLLTAAVASLAAVGEVLFRATDSSGTLRILRVALGVGSVVVSWALVHTTFTLHYARTFYSDQGGGGIDFNQEEPPRYSDFAYLAFTIGMSFQVSDTPLTAAAIRRVALIHAMMSYLLGTVILAGTVNLIVGLGK
jgi:uncharacterized membrane protein